MSTVNQGNSQQNINQKSPTKFENGLSIPTVLISNPPTEFNSLAIDSATGNFIYNVSGAWFDTKIYSKDYTDTKFNQALGATFGGSVVPSSNPAPTTDYYAFGTQAGTYTNMGGSVLPSNSFGIFSYIADTTTWSLSYTSFAAPATVLDPANTTDSQSGKSVADFVALNYLSKNISNTIGLAPDSSYSSTTGSMSTRILYSPIGVSGDASNLELWANSSGILPCFIFSRVGNVFTIKSTHNITVPTTGLVSITTGLPTGLLPTDYFGIYQTNAYAKVGFKSGSSDTWAVSGAGPASGVTFNHITTADFAIRLTVKNSGTDEDAIDAKIDLVQDQLPEILSSSTNYASYTSVSSTTSTRIMYEPVGIDGIIHTFKTNFTRGGLQKVKIVSKNPDGTFNLVSEKSVYAELGVQEVEINMQASKGQHFAWLHSTDAFIGFKSASANWYQMANTDLQGNNNTVTISTTVDFGITLNIIPDNFKSIVKDTPDPSVRPSLLPIGTINNSVFTHPTTPTLPAGWVNTTGFIPTTSGLQSPASGSWATVTYLDKLVVLDEDVSLLKVIINSATSIFSLVKASSQGRGTAIEINCSNNTMNLWSVLSNIGVTPSSIVKSVPIPAITVGREYHVIMRKTHQIYQFQFIDSITQTTTTLNWSAVGTATDMGIAWNSPGVVFRQGDIKIVEVNFSSPLPRSPKVLIVGDSLVDGDTIRTLLGGGYKNRYAGLLATALKNNISIVARAGETSTDVNDKLADIESWFIAPKYAIYELGINDTSFSVWEANMLAFKAAMDAKGTETILVTLFPRVGREEFCLQVTNYILTSGFKYVDQAKAVTIGGDRITRNSDLFLADNLHLNPTGHLVEYNQYTIDCPYLFI